MTNLIFDPRAFLSPFECRLLDRAVSPCLVVLVAIDGLPVLGVEQHLVHVVEPDVGLLLGLLLLLLLGLGVGGLLAAEGGGRRPLGPLI